MANAAAAIAMVALLSTALATLLWSSQVALAAPTGNFDEVVAHNLAGRDAADIKLTCKVNLGSTRFRYAMYIYVYIYSLYALELGYRQCTIVTSSKYFYHGRIYSIVNAIQYTNHISDI